MWCKGGVQNEAKLRTFEGEIDGQGEVTVFSAKSFDSGNRPHQVQWFLVMKI